MQGLRDEAAALRQRLANDTAEVRDAADAAERIEAGLAARLTAALSPSLRSVINATGVIVHTNLGRAPLGPTAIDRVAALAGGYTNLEYDLSEGRRGSRAVHASTLVTRLTGAEAAVVVNNNAAAVLLTLAALAAGREVIISRGELVEIGGGFRVPDVLRQSGAILREVGTTNRTRAADYAAAIGDRTAILLRVHPSNFRIEGFTERPSLAEIVRIGEGPRIPVVEDLGSGCLKAVNGIEGEPTVGESIAAGVAVCTFSGDKLLGGPQAGVIAGRRAELDRIRTHPLMRALRVDKLAYAALEATLHEHAAGRAGEAVPVVRMIEEPVARLEARAAALRARLADMGGADRLGRRHRCHRWRRQHPGGHAPEPGARDRGRGPFRRRACRRAARGGLHQWWVGSPTIGCSWICARWTRGKMTTSRPQSHTPPARGAALDGGEGCRAGSRTVTVRARRRRRFAPPAAGRRRSATTDPRNRPRPDRRTNPAGRGT